MSVPISRMLSRSGYKYKIRIVRLTLAALLILTVSPLACKKAEEVVLPPLTKDEISGERLWTRLSEEANYKTYSFFPDHDGVRPGQAPHGRLHRVYVNRVLLDALPIEERVAPEGSIIVKENLNTQRVTTKITVMAKVAGYNPEANDWFWAAFEPSGEVGAEGKPGGCISCHSGVKENDFVIIRKLDKTNPRRRR